jgi:hypothetical protein
VIHVARDDLVELENPISSKFPTTYEFHVCAAPVKNEKVFVKHVGSPFLAIELHEEVVRLGRERKVLQL